MAFGVGLGCLGQADRSYFDDLIDGSADGTTGPLDASTMDTSMPNTMDTSMPDASTPDAPITMGLDAESADGDMLDAGFDAPKETGCGPTNTVANCGQCGAACDTTTGTPTACTAGSCQYMCNTGLGDCTQNARNTNGCETPLNTTTDCTGCGVGCDTAHSNVPTCTGTTCKYTSCAAGWRDCNTTPPNADGCECHAPGCCGDASACEPLHDNGQGDQFYDCTPLGTYTSALALKACIAYTGEAGACVGLPCAKSAGDAGPIICSSGDPTRACMCWSFGGNNKGLVDNGGLPGTPGAGCYCPALSQGDTPWN